MKITKTHTETFEVKVSYPFGKKWGEFKIIREKYGLSVKKFSKCFICEKKFEPDDDLYIATASRIGNTFVCVDCWKDNKESGEQNELQTL